MPISGNVKFDENLSVNELSRLKSRLMKTNNAAMTNRTNMTQLTNKTEETNVEFRGDQENNEFNNVFSRV